MSKRKAPEVNVALMSDAALRGIIVASSSKAGPALRRECLAELERRIEREAFERGEQSMRDEQLAADLLKHPLRC